MTPLATLPWQHDLQKSARRVGAGLWAGLISGAVLGGVGGRLAMLVLRFTSDRSLHGMKTDDGFVIGEFTADTVFLLLVATAVGGLGGIFYLAVRPWLPERLRGVVMALFGAAVGGAAVIHPDGIDFALLDPLWLAVAMFIGLPALYGLAVSALAERLLAREQRFTGWLPSLLPLGALLITGPPGLIVLPLISLGWLLNRSLPLTDLWSSRPVVWAGRAALLTAGLSASLALVRDAAAILG